MLLLQRRAHVPFVYALAAVAVGLVVTTRAGADTSTPITAEKVKYKGWNDCIRLTNGQIELIATTVVGPRIIRFGLVGKENQFRELPDQVGKTGGADWRLYGGHRLWHAPEARPRTYEPDNSPVQAVMDGEVLRLVQPTEKTTGIQKELTVQMDRQGTHVRVTHKLTNRGLWPVTFAAWALTAMERSGRAVIPQSRRSTPDNLLPNRALVLWPYTNMADPRAFWGRRYVMVQQDPTTNAAFKVGITGFDGWAGYVRNGHLFLKRFTHQANEVYPDFGSSVEVYTNRDFLELETVGPLRTLQPRQSLEHVEDWYLFPDVSAEDEAAVERTIVPLIQATAPQ